MLIAFQIGLKSNMDRFIATVINLKTIALIGLKSNMDRFIADKPKSRRRTKGTFKIQYG